MDARITPGALTGRVRVPSSKSMTHRHLIAAALADGESVVSGVDMSEDIEATIRILSQLGADIRDRGEGNFHVSGGLKPSGPMTCDAGESGSTLRFLIPLGLVSGNTVTWTGRGRLAERPLTPYYRLFDEKNISYTAAGGLPLTVSGALSGGTYALPGDVSSQFFTGLLFALPLLAEDSVIMSTTALESKSYIDLTLETLALHGVTVRESDSRFEVPGGQSYRAGHFYVEGDFSHAAFWLCAGAAGGHICVDGLSPTSRQGDRVIVEIIRRMGAALKDVDDGIRSETAETAGTVIDAEDCPDLVPVLSALAAVSRGRTEIIHAARVRLKECDRLHAMAEELNKLGADITERPDGLVIEGKEKLSGGTVSSWNDHRVAMALASISSRLTGPLIIRGAESVKKSYPRFWDDFKSLGGRVELKEAP